MSDMYPLPGQVPSKCLHQDTCSAGQSPLPPQFSLVLLAVRLCLRAGRFAQHISSAQVLPQEMSYLPSPSPAPCTHLDPLAAEEGQQQGGFWSSSLLPPSSLTEPAGCSSGLEFLYQGRKIPLIVGNQVSHRGGRVIETKCRCSDMSSHKISHTYRRTSVCGSQITGAPRLRGTFWYLRDMDIPNSPGDTQGLQCLCPQTI